MEFTFTPSKSYQAPGQQHLNSEEIRNARDQLANIMQDGLRSKNKNTDEGGYNIADYPIDYGEDNYDYKRSQFPQNKGLQDEGQGNERGFLIQKIINNVRDEDIANNIKNLRDQEIARSLYNNNLYENGSNSGNDFKNMINKMHSDISQEQQQLFNKTSGNNDNKINKNRFTKSPLISARSQKVMEKKIQNGEYKPIHLRLDQIKEQKEALMEKVTMSFQKKEEPLPTFKPEINKNTDKILKRNKSSTCHVESDWGQFLNSMSEWGNRKNQHIKGMQEEKALQEFQAVTFKPQINDSTSTILQKSALLSNYYGQNGQQDVVDRLYLRMKEKKTRDQARIDEFMQQYSPFTPKINPQSEKILQLKGDKIPVIERLSQKPYYKQTQFLNPNLLQNSETSFKEEQSSPTPTIGFNKLNLSSLIPIQENETNPLINSPSKLNKSGNWDKVTKFTHSLSSNSLAQSKQINEKISVGNNSIITSTHLANNTQITPSVNNKSSGLWLQSLTNKLAINKKDSEVKQTQASQQSSSVINSSASPEQKNKISSPAKNTKNINQINNKGSSQQQDPVNNTINNMINHYNNNNKQQSSQQQDKEFVIQQSIKSGKQDNKLGVTPPTKEVNVLQQYNYSIVTPPREKKGTRLNSSPAKNSMANQLLKVQERLTKASQFQILNNNSSSSPLKDLKNTHTLEYNNNMKFMLTQLKKNSLHQQIVPNDQIHEQVETKISPLKNQNKIQQSQSQINPMTQKSPLKKRV